MTENHDPATLMVLGDHMQRHQLPSPLVIRLSGIDPMSSQVMALSLQVMADDYSTWASTLDMLTQNNDMSVPGYRRVTGVGGLDGIPIGLVAVVREDEMTEPEFLGLVGRPFNLTAGVA